VLTARRSLSKTIGLILLSFAFAGAGLAMALHWLPVEPGSFVEFIGWVTLLFFGGGGIFSLRFLFEQGPVLEVRPEGLLYRRVSNELLLWNEVESMHVINVRGTKFVCLKLAAVVRDRLYTGGIKRYLADLSRRMGYPGDLCIAATGLDRSFDDIVDAIKMNLFRARENAHFI